MKKNTKVAFSLLLIVCMLISGMPIVTPAIAVGTDNQASESITGTLPVEAVATDTVVLSDDAIIVEEDTTLRGEYEKHFRLSDGSYMAATYNEPVHYEEDGQWKEIDNTLALRTDTLGIARYETVDGLTNVSFAQQFQNKLVTMERDGYSITWGVSAQRNPSTSEVVTVSAQQFGSTASLLTADLSSICTEEQKTMAVKASSALRYNDALGQNVDLEYTILSSRVKESIILNSPQSISSYTISVETEGMSARLLDNRQVEFYNEKDEVIFTMWAPYMYDASGAMSEDIQVRMACVGVGQYRLFLTPDVDWLSNPNRVYPVVIDPDISNNHFQTNCMDNYVLQGAGNQNGNLDRIYFGNRSNGTARAFIKYGTMPILPIDAIILSATQTLTITNGTSSANPINAYMVTGGDWTENTISWDNMPAASWLLASNISHNGMTKYLIDCTQAVEYWYAGSMAGRCENYGLMIRYSDETINDYNATYSSECTINSKLPLLSIRYHTESDLFWPAPDHYQISSKWGYRNFDSKVHRGIDIVCDELTLIAAISGNVRTFSDVSAGCALVIEKPDSSFQVRYYHLKQGGYIVSSGYVEAGDEIAISGNTGTSTGPHLHFQLQWGNDKFKSYNPIDTYHPNDQRSTWTNPNPLFIYIELIDAYRPNHSFEYEYTASDYNSTDISWARG